MREEDDEMQGVPNSGTSSRSNKEERVLAMETHQRHLDKRMNTFEAKQQEMIDSGKQSEANILAAIARLTQGQNFQDAGATTLTRDMSATAQVELCGDIRPNTVRSSAQQSNIYSSQAQGESDGSEIDDFQYAGYQPSRHNRGGKRRRQWRPENVRFYDSSSSGYLSVLADILQREHYAGGYIGDDGIDSIGAESDQTVRIGTANINKNIRCKIEDEVAEWMIGHKMDILVLSDADLPGKTTQRVWMTSNENGGKVPALTLVGCKRVAILIQMERWENRLDKNQVLYSDSERSIRIVLRLASGRKLWIIGTYIHHTPDQHEREVIIEWNWIRDQVPAGQELQAMVIVSGDFNTYQNEELDRRGNNPRPHAAVHMGQQFKEWMDNMQLTSTFRVRHTSISRFTYDRGDSRSTLDDIYISNSHIASVRQSGIWTDSLHSSDHIGVPFAELHLERNTSVSNTLRGAKDIRVVNTRKKTQDEMTEYTIHTQTMVDDGRLRLIEDTITDSSSPDEILRWLARSVDNVQQCLYKSGKSLWGESSQSKQYIARRVGIKHSRVCNGQLKALRRYIRDSSTGDTDIHDLVENITWPIWVKQPERLIPGSAHEVPTQALQYYLENPPRISSDENYRDWFETVYKAWRKVLKIRRDWRKTQRQKTSTSNRQQYFNNNECRQFLKHTLNKGSPPVSIRSAIIADNHTEPRYSEDREEVTRELTHLLDTWVPPAERTSRPNHLDNWEDADPAELPHFVKEWIIPDMQQQENQVDLQTNFPTAWSDYQYNEDAQFEVDKILKKRVAPGYGGVSQEMWIAAPFIFRCRERRIINLIMQIGKAPKVIRRKQVIFLPKTRDSDSTLDNSKGLPPWRPITVQSALASRLQCVIKKYVEVGLPNHILQHSFQKTRTVNDASLLTTLLIERAKENQESLFLVSKDCLKCYDRIPAWVMEYIYRRLSVPDTPRTLMIDLLGAGQMDVRTDFGWINTGEREFGIGQGSILSILHIGYYMDLIQEKMHQGEDQVSIHHHQTGGGMSYASAVFVDDQLDIATSYAGIQHRAATSNVFTGKYSTGGVFGAAKSFMTYYTPRKQHFEPVHLNDGDGNPQPIQIVAPSEGFKHLGIMQGVEDLWARTIHPVWMQIQQDAKRITRMQLSLPEFRYIVNHIWIPRLKYRSTLSGAIRMADDMDKFIRQIARQVLKLPYSLPRYVYHDEAIGLGLHSCVADTKTYRVNELLRILNTPTLPVYHVVMDRLEAYQERAGLTQCPLEDVIRPPNHIQTWLASNIRALADMRNVSKVIAKWKTSDHIKSKRSCDRMLTATLPPHLQSILVALNWNSSRKLRYVGDLCNASGTKMKTQEDLQSQFTWKSSQQHRISELYSYWETTLVHGETRILCEAVGWLSIAPTMFAFSMRIGIGSWILAAQIRGNPDTPEYVTHEIGYRFDEQVQDDEFGKLIHIRWWREYPRGSDVWIERTHNHTSWEYEDVCVVIDPEHLPVARGRKPKVIVWSDTSVGELVGRTPRSALDEAISRSHRRYMSVERGERVPDMATNCYVCKRQRHAEFCTHCVRYHHANCVTLTCNAVWNQVLSYNQLVEAAWPCLTSHVIADEYQYQVGDGSVFDANTEMAVGGWAYLDGQGEQMQGQLLIHRSDITSTRCELHALIAGLAHTQDTGTQICDNRSAISLFNKAHRIQSRASKEVIKYGDKHRMELKTLVSLMQDSGRMTCEWVGSHQEHEHTTDMILLRKRRALAVADTSAKTALTATMMQSYADKMCMDNWLLVDNTNRIVMGNVLEYLHTTLQRQSTTEYILKVQAKPAELQYLYTRPLPMPTMCHWDQHLCRFYWRAITGQLHTNAKKHLFDDRWSPQCRICQASHVDTQSHRFGVCAPRCELASELDTMLNQSHCEIERELYLPDQRFLIPMVGANLAKSFNLPARVPWTDSGTKKCLWSTMVELTLGLWCDSHWLDAVVDPTDIVQRRITQTHLFREHREPKYSPGGRLIPTSLSEALRQIMNDQGGRYKIRLSQWTPGWYTATSHFRFQWPLKLVEKLAHPSVCREWWIDDTYIPHTAGWWEDTIAEIRLQHDQSTAAVYWITTYACQPGTRSLEELQPTWMLEIPPGSLRMRTDRSVYQTTTTKFKEVFSTNPDTIKVGYISLPSSDPQYHARAMQVWTSVLMRDHSTSWIRYGFSSHVDPFTTVPHPLFNLTSQQTTLRTISDLPVFRDLVDLFPTVYQSPVGWRMFPTMTESTLSWCQALSYTSKGAKVLHTRLFTRHWEILRRYWNISCQRTVEMIAEGNLESLHEDVNTGIRTRIHDHNHAAGSSQQKRISSSLHKLSIRSTAWHQDRVLSMQRNTQLFNEYPPVQSNTTTNPPSPSPPPEPPDDIGVVPPPSD